MKRLLLILLITGTNISLIQARAMIVSTNANLCQLLTTGQCPGCDLTGLQYSDLQASSLQSQCYQTGSVAKITNLAGANMTGANLAAPAGSPALNWSGVNFTGANFSGADLSGIIATGNTTLFTNASLYSADMTNGKFDGANFTGAGFGSATLTGASFIGSTLVNLEEQITNSLNIINSKKQPITIQANTYIDLRGQTLININFTGANLSGINLSGTNLNSINLTNANLTNTNLTGATINASNNLTNAIFSNTNFTNANLTGAVFNGPIVFGPNSSAPAGTTPPSIFTNANMQNVDVSAILNMSSQINYVINNSNVENKTFALIMQCYEYYTAVDNQLWALRDAALNTNSIIIAKNGATPITIGTFYAAVPST